MKLLIGTKNPAKQNEFWKIFTNIAKQSNIKLKISFPQDLNIKGQPDELGKTYFQNALIKAKYYYSQTKIPTLADDGGFEIKILNNQPGIKSNRWLGNVSTDQSLIKHTLKLMDKYHDKKQRKASLVLCVVYYDCKKILKQTSSINGYIADKPTKKVIRGFPYRSLLKVLPLDKYYDELTKKEHQQYNHRQKAVNKLWCKLY